jgi:hypothetical protein
VGLEKLEAVGVMSSARLYEFEGFVRLMKGEVNVLRAALRGGRPVNVMMIIAVMPIRKDKIYFMCLESSNIYQLVKKACMRVANVLECSSGDTYSL